MKKLTTKKNSAKDKKIADLEFIIRLQENVIDRYDSALANTSSRFIDYAKAFWHNLSLYEKEKINSSTICDRYGLFCQINSTPNP